MRKVEHYICDVCGTGYYEKARAQECESGHKQPERITKAQYHPIGIDAKGYPQSIAVLMSDGATVTYKR